MGLLLMAITEHHHDNRSYQRGGLETSLSVAGAAFASIGRSWVSGLDWTKLGVRWAAAAISAAFWIEVAILIARAVGK